MKKAAVMLIFAVLLAACLGCGGYAEPEVLTDGDFEYTVLEDGTAEIVRYSGNQEELDIPEVINGYPVTGIGAQAFDRLGNLRIVHIPEGVIRIGDQAFYGCHLTSVTIPDSVAYVGANPFMYCEGLRDIVVSPFHPYLAVIDSVLFSKPDKRLISFPYSFNSEITSYEIPYGTEIIGDCAIMSSRSLTSITIPDTVTRIGEEAFFGCTAVTSLTLPGHVAGIGRRAFSRWFALKELTLPDSMTAIEYGAFSECTALESLTIPDSVTEIGPYSFSGCTALPVLSIPENVIRIGEGAFSGCSSLKSVTLPEGLAEIGIGAFTGCSSLTVTVFPESPAEKYCRENNIPYTYFGETDHWLGHIIDEKIMMPYRTDPEVSVEIPFSTEMFRQSSKVFRNNLAGLSILLSTAAYEQENVQPGTAICSAYHALGIADDDIMLFNYTGHPLNNPDYTDTDHELFSVANKKMGEYILLFVTLRGSGKMFRSNDWLTNMEVLFANSPQLINVQVHQGFNQFANLVCVGLCQYTYQHPDVARAISEGRVKVLITGHSLGGGASNLIGAYIMSGMYGDLLIPQDDLFVYTFATPRSFNTLDNKAPDTADCLNIFNIVIEDDPVPEIPKDYRGNIWQRFGITYVYKTTYQGGPYDALEKMHHHEMQNYINAVFYHEPEKTQVQFWYDVAVSNAH